MLKEKYLDEITATAGGNIAQIDLQEIRGELKNIDASAAAYEQGLRDLLKRTPARPPAALTELNQTLYRTERALVSGPGLPGREWYRYRISAPGMYTGYSAKTLPGVREAVERGRWEEARTQAQAVAVALRELNSRIQEAARQAQALAQ